MASTARKAVQRQSDVRKRRSPEDLKERIIAAAGVEFRRTGYGGTTTAAIAKRARVTEAQLFRYFGSKANLFREAVFKPLDQQFLEFFERHARAGETPATFRRDAADYIGDLQCFLQDNADMLMSLLVAQRYDPGMARADGAIATLASYFERGAANMRSHSKRKPRVDPQLMVRVSFAAVLGCVMFREWLFPKGLADPDEIQAAINDFVLDGISLMRAD